MDNFVTDRSPLDNIAYYLTQNCAQSSEIEATQHIARSLKFVESFTHIINIRFVNEERQIEDNGSRIVNPYFQELMDNTFQLVIRNYFMKHKPAGLAYMPYLFEIGFWDLEARKKAVKEFITDNPHPA